MFEDGFPSWIVPIALICLMGIAIAGMIWVRGVEREKHTFASGIRARDDNRMTLVTIASDAVVIRIEFDGRSFVSAKREVDAWHDIVDQIYNGENCKTAAGFAVFWDAVVKSNTEHRTLYAKVRKENADLEEMNARQERIIDGLHQKVNRRRRMVDTLVEKIRADRNESSTLGKDLVALQNLIAGLAERCHGQSELLTNRAAKAVATGGEPIEKLGFLLPPGKLTPGMVKAFNEMPTPEQK